MGAEAGADEHPGAARLGRATESGGVRALRVRCGGVGVLRVEERVVYADSSPVADGRSQRGERCQKAPCAEKARQLAAEQKAHAQPATQRVLETERATRAVLVRGEVRAAVVGREAEAAQLDVLRREAKDLLKQRPVLSDGLCCCRRRSVSCSRRARSSLPTSPRRRSSSRPRSN